MLLLLEEGSLSEVTRLLAKNDVSKSSPSKRPDYIEVRGNPWKLLIPRKIETA